MDILKASIDWVRAELFSTPFFILFGVCFITAGIGFWQLGKTDLAKAYVIPTFVAGALLMVIGVGLFFTNKSRLAKFPAAYEIDAQAFIDSEITRTKDTLKEYQNVVFTGIPIILALCAISLTFLKGPAWRASLITSMAMLVVIMLIDGTAFGRIDVYNKQLTEYKTELNKK